MTIVEMRVHMDCPGCESKIKKALSKLDGVSDINIDMNMQKVTVTGWADEKKVLKKVRKTGRTAELWPFPYNPQYHDYAYHYYTNTNTNTNTNYYSSSSNYLYLDHSDNYISPTNYFPTESPSTYNYHVHGYNGHEHGYYQQPPSSAILDEQASAMFSDDNATGCSIM